MPSISSFTLCVCVCVFSELRRLSFLGLSLSLSLSLMEYIKRSVMKDKKVSFTEAKAALVSLSLPFVKNSERASEGVSVSLSRSKKRFHMSDEEPRKHTDTTTKKGAPETFLINNNTL